MSKTNLFFTFFFSVFFQYLVAQNHVKWETRYDKQTSEIVISAKIETNWHLYSINNAEDLGPVPTFFNFPKQKGLKLQGKVVEQAPKVAFDSNFGATVGYHEVQAEFRQKVKIKKTKKIHLLVTYMVCDDAQCLPPIEITLEVNVL